jgi:hypothetical protein
MVVPRAEVGESSDAAHAEQHSSSHAAQESQCFKGIDGPEPNLNTNGEGRTEKREPQSGHVPAFAV